MYDKQLHTLSTNQGLRQCNASLLLMVIIIHAYYGWSC